MTVVVVMGLAQLMPRIIPSRSIQRQQRGIFLLVMSGIVFRSEVAVLLLAQLLYMLVQPTISLQTIIRSGVKSAAIAVSLTVILDSYFYQRLTWPELQAFFFNAIQGKSSDWGTSPWYTYFLTALPRLLLNPVILYALVPFSMYLPATRNAAKSFVVPSFVFIALYSILPHKEPRFIIYTVPLFTASAALASQYIWLRRNKSLVYQGATIVILTSIVCSFAMSIFMLLISSLNYPGGEALHQVFKIMEQDIEKYTKDQTTSTQAIEAVLEPRLGIHTDILSMMTGVTLFLAHSYTPYLGNLSAPSGDSSNIPIYLDFDKTEREDWLLIPEHWQRFDYALMEHPEYAIGAWEVAHTVWAYKGMQLLRPGQWAAQDDTEVLHRAYERALKVDAGSTSAASSHNAAESPVELHSLTEQQFSWKQLYERWHASRGDRFEAWRLVRDSIRKMTRGWYFGPRMEPEIRILRRADGRRLFDSGR